jgi:hypothetical protein
VSSSYFAGGQKRPLPFSECSGGCSSFFVILGVLLGTAAHLDFAGQQALLTPPRETHRCAMLEFERCLMIELGCSTVPLHPKICCSRVFLPGSRTVHVKLSTPISVSDFVLPVIFCCHTKSCPQGHFFEHKTLTMTVFSDFILPAFLLLFYQKSPKASLFLAQETCREHQATRATTTTATIVARTMSLRKTTTTNLVMIPILNAATGILAKEKVAQQNKSGTSRGHPTEHNSATCDAGGKTGPMHYVVTGWPRR